MRRMWRSTDWRKAWPLLSSRLKRLVRQKPISRLPARDRSCNCVRFGRRRRVVRRRGEVVAKAVARQVERVDRIDHVGCVEPGVLVGGFLSSIVNFAVLGSRVGK